MHRFATSWPDSRREAKSVEYSQWAKTKGSQWTRASWKPRTSASCNQHGSSGIYYKRYIIIFFVKNARFKITFLYSSFFKSWDNELEKIAQTWASQCNFAHDSCRDVGKIIIWCFYWKFNFHVNFIEFISMMWIYRTFQCWPKHRLHSYYSRRQYLRRWTVGKELVQRSTGLQP